MTNAKNRTPTTDLLTRSERPDPVFGAAEVAGWPVGTLDRSVGLGLLVETDPVPSATCTACDPDHVEPVRWVRDPDLPPRACIVCGSYGIVWLNPDELRRWAVRLPVLARLVAGAIGASGEVVERVPGRVWKLGTVRLGGLVWVGALAVGLTRPDAAAVVGAVPELRAPNALVFVATVPPAPAVWSPNRVPAVVPLCDFVTLGPDGLAADRDALTSALPVPAPSAARAPARVFPAPSGTAWEQVALAVGEHHLCVRVGAVAERFGFAEAGFENRREKNKPDEVWALLRLLARLGGRLGTEDAVKTKPGKLKQKVSALRDRLRALLALDGDPFHPNQRGQPYRARFTIRAEGETTFPTPPGATWDNITVTETAAGMIEVAVTAEARGAAFVRVEGVTDRGKWEGTTDTGERRHRFTLADLGLTGPDAPTPAGEALVAVLRAGGRLTRPADDAGLLALGGALTRFFQIADPPFTFDRKRRQWVAAFEASSGVSGR